MWNNSLIRIENKPIFFKDWSSKGITKVKHLQSPESNNYLSVIKFQQKFDLIAPPLSFYGIISAVKGLGNSSIKKENDIKYEYEPLSVKLLKAKKVSLLVYKTLVRNKGEIPSNSPKKRLLDCGYPCNQNRD